MMQLYWRWQTHQQLCEDLALQEKHALDDCAALYAHQTVEFDSLPYIRRFSIAFVLFCRYVQQAVRLRYFGHTVFVCEQPPAPPTNAAGPSALPQPLKFPSPFYLLVSVEGLLALHPDTQVPTALASVCRSFSV
jgi:hypothetical protein